MRVRPLLFALTVIVASACGSSSNDDEGLFGGAGGAGPSGSCVPNQQIACACPGTTQTGVQTCDASGAGYGSCLGCPGSFLGGGGTAGSGVGGASTGGSGGTSSQGGTGVGGKAGTSSSGSGGTSSQGGSGPCGSGGPDVDQDGDGFTGAQGDCNDCDPAINPGAFDGVDVDPKTGAVLPVQIDNDCDGLAATADPVCDDGLPIVVTDPFDAAKAIGLCNVKVPEVPSSPKDKKWGVIGARLSAISGPFLGVDVPKAVGKDGSLSYGILPSFGAATTPRQGSNMLAMSSGEARAPGQPGYDAASVCGWDKGYQNAYPDGFPKQGTCGTTGEPHDGVGLDLRIRVPTNATSFSFAFRFFTCEFPQYTCSTYNDVFAALVDPSPFPGDPMSPDVAFELTPSGKKNVIGVNNESFLTSCKPGTAVSGNYACKGDADLVGTGFDTHGASAWLRSTAPVKPGSIMSIRFAIWDSADGILDSTAVVDDFRWGIGGDLGTHVDPGTGGSGGTGVGGGTSTGGSGGDAFGAGGGSGAGGDPFGGGGSGGFAGATAGSAGTSTGGSSGAPGGVGPCSDGTCSTPGQCCKGLGMPCGTDFGGMLCL